MQTNLTELTATAFARQRGHPNGYSLKAGKWLYRLLDANFIAEKNAKDWDLADESDYAGMRRQMNNGKWKYVLVMHETVWDEAYAKKSAPKKEEEIGVERQCPGAEDGWRWTVDEDFVDL